MKEKVCLCITLTSVTVIAHSFFLWKQLRIHHTEVLGEESKTPSKALNKILAKCHRAIFRVQLCTCSEDLIQILNKIAHISIETSDITRH